MITHEHLYDSAKGLFAIGMIHLQDMQVPPSGSGSDWISLVIKIGIAVATAISMYRKRKKDTL